MLRAIQTHNALLIKEIAAQPKLWDRLSEDHAPDPDTWMPDMRYPWLLFVREEDDETEVFGVCALIPQTPIVTKFHPGFLPEKWGDARNVEFGKLAIQWAWENTDAVKIVALCPVIYKDSLRFAQRVGLQREGINRKSFLKDGELHDQYHLGISRE